MTKYHINPSTGRAGQCKAQSPESCKFSVESGVVIAHYDSKDDAKAAYEKLNQSKTLNTLTARNQKAQDKPKTNSLQENRTKLSSVNTRVERLTANLQSRKFKLMDLDKSLSLDKTKEERNEIYEKIKKEKEDILYLDKTRKDSLKEQKELAQKIEKQLQSEKSENSTSTEDPSIDDFFQDNGTGSFFRGGCGASGGC